MVSSILVVSYLVMIATHAIREVGSFFARRKGRKALDKARYER